MQRTVWGVILFASIVDCSIKINDYFKCYYVAMHSLLLGVLYPCMFKATSSQRYVYVGNVKLSFCLLYTNCFISL